MMDVLINADLIDLTIISITNGDIVTDDEVMRTSVVYSIHVYISKI
jgi:hypothetical protein